MTTDRDPVVQGLFAAASHDAATDDIVADVMSRIRAIRRRTIIVWSCIAVVAVGIGLFFAPAVVDAVEIFSRMLPQPLIELRNPDALAALFLSPLNSIAVPVAILFLAILKLFRMLL